MAWLAPVPSREIPCPDQQTLDVKTCLNNKSSPSSRRTAFCAPRSTWETSCSSPAGPRPAIPTDARPTWPAPSPRSWACRCKWCRTRSPGELADDAEKDKWDIGLIGAEPARAEKIDFTAAYVEIEATYLVPAGSPIKSIAEVDVKGNRIAVDRAQRL